MPPYNAARIALIDKGECPNPGCHGKLGGSDERGWRPCDKCGDRWKTDVIHGERYDCVARAKKEEAKA